MVRSTPPLHTGNGVMLSCCGGVYKVQQVDAAETAGSAACGGAQSAGVGAVLLLGGGVITVPANPAAASAPAHALHCCYCCCSHPPT
jgi:hypothetical protein